MNTHMDLDKLTRTTRRREFDDGLFDVLMSAIFLILCLLTALAFNESGLKWYIRLLVQHREVTIIGTLTLIPLLVLMFFGGRRLIMRIRQATFWKDRGYVEPLRIQVSRFTSMIAATVTIGIILGSVWLMTQGILGSDDVLRTLVASSGLATGIVYIGLGISLQLRRYIIVGCVGGILSTIIVITPLSFVMSWVWVGLIWGFLLFLSGIWALRMTMSEQKSSKK